MDWARLYWMGSDALMMMSDLVLFLSVVFIMQEKSTFLTRDLL